MNANSKKELLGWINWAKVVCLFIVYLYHTESRSGYYVGNIDEVIEPFFVNIFFVISGYLIFRKQLKTEVATLKQNKWIEKYGIAYIKNINYKIVIPTILFGALLFIPKVLIRGGTVDYNLFFRQSIGGCGLWFTPALATAELFLFVALVFRKINPHFVLLCSIIFSLSAFLFKSVGISGYPWFWQTGMCATVFVAIGGVLFDMEQRIKAIKPLYVEMVSMLGIIVYVAVNIIIPPPLV